MNSTNIDELNDLEDIETNINTLRKTATSLDNYTNMESSNNNCSRIIILLIFLIISFPITFCDLYYCYNDDTCVSEPLDKLDINLQDYLFVYGWIQITFICLFCFCFCFLGIHNYDNIMKFTNIVYSILNIFLIIWNIMGAIIFWSLMDTTKCSNSIYGYVFISLIFKLACNFSLCLRTNLFDN